VLALGHTPFLAGHPLLPDRAAAILAEWKVLAVRTLPGVRTSERVLQRNGLTAPRVRLAPLLPRQEWPAGTAACGSAGPTNGGTTNRPLTTRLRAVPANSQGGDAVAEETPSELSAPSSPFTRFRGRRARSDP
jgi:hypothetical protein